MCVKSFCFRIPFDGFRESCKQRCLQKIKELGFHCVMKHHNEVYL